MKILISSYVCILQQHCMWYGNIAWKAVLKDVYIKMNSCVTD